MNHLITIADLTNREMEQIFDLADVFGAQGFIDLVRKICFGKIMATLFYESSTRTRLSFESSMQRLGGSVISCSDMGSSSTAKGESIEDTARVVSNYADILVIRHHQDGAVGMMAEHAKVPVINAGDGSHEHPTQALCDLYTLKKEKGELKGLTMAICGDTKYNRTINSLVPALIRFGVHIIYVNDLSEIDSADAIYVTRQQKERGQQNINYLRIGESFLKEKRFKDMIIMHPLPRVDEISRVVDMDRRGVYFKQAAYGVPIRMALLKVMLS